MTALHIVGIDLQHGLSVHTRRRGGAEVGIGLVADGLLGALTNQDAAGKGSHGAVVQHIFIQLVALAVGNLMVYEGVIVHMLRLVSNDTAVEDNL